MISPLYALYEKARHLSVDWYLFGYMFALSLLFITTAWKLISDAKKLSISVSKKGPESSAETSPDSNALILTPLQGEILHLSRDLHQLLKEAGPPPELQNTGPMKKGEDAQAWTKQQTIEADEWTKAYSEWARKLIYNYRQRFSERVKKAMHSLGANTGMVVVSLEPYTTDIRPGADFQQLIDILLEFFVKLEKRREESQQ
jgi:hypothetical protein